MYEVLDDQTLFVTVAMLSDADPSLILVTEGHYDHLTLSRLASEDLVVHLGSPGHEASGGKQMVLDAAQLAHDNGLGGVRFLVDRDFDDQVKPHVEHAPNVLTTSHHDMFMDLIAASPEKLAHMVDTYLGESRIRDPKKNPPSVRSLFENALRLASYLSVLRVVNELNMLGLKFKDFSFRQVKPLDSFRDLARAVLQRSRGSQIELEDLVARCEQVSYDILGNPMLNVGDHDFFLALSFTLYNYKVISGHDLHVNFISGITAEDVMKTSWGDEIDKWCAENQKSAFLARSSRALV